MTTVKLTVAEDGFAEQLLKDLAFDPANLDEAFINHSGNFAFYSEQARLLSKKMDNSKLRVDIIESELDKEIRDEAAKAGIKLTEKAIEAQIVAAERYQKAVMIYNDAKATHQMLRDALDGFKQRKDMLIHLGLNRRDEQRQQALNVRETGYEDSLKARRESILG